ncbi:MAG: nucleoside transporter [Planctomycetota bacterium]|jgi:nucleoside transporter
MTANATPAAPLSFGLGSRLSLMMFLQYAIWGAWLPFLWDFLSRYREMDGGDIGNMFAAGAVGAIIGPFIAGQVADRYFATEKFLGVSHLIGAVLIWQLASIDSYWGFLIFSLLYGLIFSPTLALTNSLAFHHLPDRDRDFGRVRLFGTIGWIVVGLGMGHWLANMHQPIGLGGEDTLLALAEGKADAFRLSAILGALMGLFCFTLPSTPPSKGSEKNATFEALGEIKLQPLRTLFLLAIPVSCIHQFYFVHTEGFLSAQQLAAPGWTKTIFGAGGGGLMTVGQMSEVPVLLLLPFIAKKVSRKWLLAIGLIAYSARMALFAYADQIPVSATLALLTGLTLHGLCFGCFIFVAFMIVDEETSKDVRASAQNLFNLVIIGIGVIVGSKIAGWTSEWASASGEMDYTKLFGVPMWAALICFVLLLIAYPAKSPLRGDLKS